MFTRTVDISPAGVITCNGDLKKLMVMSKPKPRPKAQAKAKAADANQPNYAAPKPDDAAPKPDEVVPAIADETLEHMMEYLLGDFDLENGADVLNGFTAEQSTDDDPPPEPHAEEELPDDDHNCESTHIEQVHNENFRHCRIRQGLWS